MREKYRDIFRSQAVLFVLILLIIIMGIFKHDTFLTIRNLTIILRQITVLGIFACGMTMVLISGSLDLSVGSLYSICMVVAVLLQKFGFNLFFSILITLIIGFSVGSTNGFLIGKLKVNAFIVTLGMAAILQGIALIISNGNYVMGNPKNTNYVFIGSGKIFEVPFPVFIFIFITIISYIILNKTTFGRSIYVTGGNQIAAFSSGINVGNIQLLSFSILGLYCAIGGIITSSLILSGDPFGGRGFEFDVITAAVLGGTSLSGGKGNIFNTIIGVLLIGVISNSMIIINLPFNFQPIIKGLILIAAVYYDVKSRGGR